MLQPFRLTCKETGNADVRSALGGCSCRQHQVSGGIAHALNGAVQEDLRCRHEECTGRLQLVRHLDDGTCGALERLSQVSIFVRSTYCTSASGSCLLLGLSCSTPVQGRCCRAKLQWCALPLTGWLRGCADFRLTSSGLALCRRWPTWGCRAVLSHGSGWTHLTTCRPCGMRLCTAHLPNPSLQVSACTATAISTSVTLLYPLQLCKGFLVE